MAGITLDQIRESAERKYGDFVVELGDGVEVRLRSALRLGKAERDSLNVLRKQHAALTENDDVTIDDSLDLLCQQICLLAVDKAAAESMLALIGDDPAVLLSVIEAYAEASELGEA